MGIIFINTIHVFMITPAIKLIFKAFIKKTSVIFIEVTTNMTKKGNKNFKKTRKPYPFSVVKTNENSSQHKYKA